MSNVRDVIVVKVQLKFHFPQANSNFYFLIHICEFQLLKVRWLELFLKDQPHYIHLHRNEGSD